MEKPGSQILSGPLKQAIHDNPDVGKRLGEYQGKIDREQAEFYAWIKQENLNQAESPSFQKAIKLVEEDLKELYPGAPNWRNKISHLFIIDIKDRKKVNKWLEKHTPSLKPMFGSIETCLGFASVRNKLCLIFAENTTNPNLRDYFTIHHELGHAIGWNISVNTLNQKPPESTNESFEFSKNFSTGLLSVTKGTSLSRGRLLEEAVVERDSFIFVLRSDDPELVKQREELVKYYSFRKMLPSFLNLGEIQETLDHVSDLIYQMNTTNRLDEQEEIKQEIVSLHLELSEANHYRQARVLLNEMIEVMGKFHNQIHGFINLDDVLESLTALPRALRLARVAPKEKKKLYQLLEKTFDHFGFPFSKKIFSHEFSEKGIEPLLNYVKHFSAQLQITLDLKDK